MEEALFDRHCVLDPVLLVTLSRVVLRHGRHQTYLRSAVPTISWGQRSVYSIAKRLRKNLRAKVGLEARLARESAMVM